jgi:hypothetical protein
MAGAEGAAKKLRVCLTLDPGVPAACLLVAPGLAGTIEAIDQSHRSSGGPKREPSSRMLPTTLPSASTS